MSKKGKLTDKQEMFVQELIKGKSQRKAYRTAYKNDKGTDKTADETACRLLKNPKISARYDELRAEATERTMWSYEIAQKELLEMLIDSKKSRNFNGRYNSIKELNTLAGLYDKKKEEKEDKAWSFFDKLGELI